MGDITTIFMYDLFNFLTGQFSTSFDSIKLFRKHNNKLEKNGELSFPLNKSGWSKYINIESKILEYIEKHETIKLTESNFEELLNESKSWCLNINSIQIQNNKLNLYLNRSTTFKTILKNIFLNKEKYGSSDLNIQNFYIKEDIENTEDLTSLRVHLIKKLTINILKHNGCTVSEDINLNDIENTIYFTTKSESKCTSKKIVCGAVISNKFGKKNTNISSNEFYRKRAVDMQLMAQHKYGVRVHSEPGWADFFKQLGDAAVSIDLLHVKPSRPVIVHEDSSASTCSKGASFILYNCARLSEIFRKFDKMVSEKQVPSLPSLDEIDFNLLNQTEEWELLYIYLMQYPSTVRSCVADILDGRLNTHNLCVFLDSLCSTFSVYYRRVRILMEPRSHLYPVMHARIHLLAAIQQILHNALALIDIPPIKQM